MKISRYVIQALCVLGLWLGWGLQAHAQTDTVTYVYTDPQGTPLVEADAQGNVIARYDYTPYGNAVASLGGAPNGPGYTGHVNDPETGLVYMQARYYDPAVGRFLSTDPVGPASGNAFNFNRYAYANNNPIINTDPDGRAPAPWYVRAWASVKGIMNTPTARRIVADIGAGELAGAEGEEGAPTAGMAGEETMIEQMELEEMESTSGGPYSNLKDPKSVGPSKPYTRAQKVAILKQNAEKNGGVLKSDKSGITLVPSKQSKAGVPTPSNAAQIDHYVPQHPDDPDATPGTNSYSNAQVLSAQENNEKSNTMPPPPPPPTNQQ